MLHYYWKVIKLVWRFFVLLVVLNCFAFPTGSTKQQHRNYCIEIRTYSDWVFGIKYFKFITSNFIFTPYPKDQKNGPVVLLYFILILKRCVAHIILLD